MKRIVMLVVAALVMAAMMLAMAMPAFANADSSDNCIATKSSAITHNGLGVRNQNRQAEIKGLQASCNNANSKWLNKLRKGIVARMLRSPYLCPVSANF